jgi:ATP-binding cassette subfamily B protein
MALEVGFFDATKTGELISRLASDTAVLKDAVTTNISMAVRWLATALGGTIYLFVLSWKLALVMVAVIPVIAISSVVYGRYVRSLSKDAQKALADASEVAEETFSAIRTVRSFVGEPKQTKHYDDSIATTLDIGIRNAWAGGVFIGITTAVSSCSFIGIVYYGGQLVIQGDITEGVLTAFLLYAIQIGGALGGLAGLFGSIMSAMGANDRVFKLLDRVPKMPVSGEGIRPDSFSGQIELDDVHFAYPTRPDAPVLKGLALKINPGEVHALVGSSGGGKSTVVNLIERFYDVQSGSVRLDGRDVRELDPSWVRAQMGLVRQEPVLFGCSIRENIAFGRPQATEEEIQAAARLANAHDFVTGFPDGYDTIVGEKGVRLSGGQKQRIAIAAATLSGVSDTGPKVLLLDEATSALDSESEHLVQTALERLMVGRTTLIVAHRLSTVRSADVVHVVHGGKVVASGSHDELIRTSALYSALVRRQLSGLSGSADAASSAPAAVAAAGGSSGLDEIEDETLALEIAAEQDAATFGAGADDAEGMFATPASAAP